MPDGTSLLPMLVAALDYAGRGVPVFPCNPGSKKPLTEHGFKDATTSQAIISAWWMRWPDAMVGAPTGEVSGIVVLDVDQDAVKGTFGDISFAELIEREGELPDTALATTPRGGRH